MNSSDNRKHRPEKSGSGNSPQETWNMSPAVCEELEQELARAIAIQRKKPVSRWPWRKERYSSLAGRKRPAGMESGAPTDQELEAVRLGIGECRELTGRELYVIRHQVRAYSDKGFFGRMWARLFGDDPISVYRKIEKIIMLQEFRAKVRRDPVAGIEMYRQSVFPEKVGYWDRLTKGWRMMLDRAYSSAAIKALQQAEKDIGEFHAAFRSTCSRMLVTAYATIGKLSDQGNPETSLHQLQVQLKENKKILGNEIREIRQQCQRFLDAQQQNQLGTLVLSALEEMADEETFLGTFCGRLLKDSGEELNSKPGAGLASEVTKHFEEMEDKIRAILNDTKTSPQEKCDSLENLDLTGNILIYRYLDGIRAGELNRGKADELLVLFQFVKTQRKNIDERKSELVEQARMEREELRIVLFNPPRVQARLMESRQVPFQLPVFIEERIQKLSASITGNGITSTHSWDENLELFTDILVLMRRWLECARWTLGNRFEEERKDSVDRVEKVHLMMRKLYHSDHNDAERTRLVTDLINNFENHARDIAQQAEPPVWLAVDAMTLKNEVGNYLGEMDRKAEERWQVMLQEIDNRIMGYFADLDRRLQQLREERILERENIEARFKEQETRLQEQETRQKQEREISESKLKQEFQQEREISESRLKQEFQQEREISESRLKQEFQQEREISESKLKQEFKQEREEEEEKRQANLEARLEQERNRNMQQMLAMIKQMQQQPQQQDTAENTGSSPTLGLFGRSS